MIRYLRHVKDIPELHLKGIDGDDDKVMIRLARRISF